MDAVTLAAWLLQATETPEVGTGELLDYLPVLYQLAWFFGTFLAVMALGWFLVEPAISRFVRGRNRNNPTLQSVITRYVRLTVGLVAVLIGLAAAGFGYVIGDSILVLAAGTLAVGVAGQTVLGSLVSGIVLVADPEFNVGDYIEWSDGSGTVQSITLRVTRVITPNGELVTVPNTKLTGDVITRPYGRVRYRLVDRIGVDYEDDVSEAMAIMERVADEHEDVAGEPSPKVYIEEFSPDWVTCRVHYWIADPERREALRIRSAYSKTVKEELEAAGIAISPPSKRDLEGEVAVSEGREA